MACPGRSCLIPSAGKRGHISTGSRHMSQRTQLLLLSQTIMFTLPCNVKGPAPLPLYHLYRRDHRVLHIFYF